MDRFLARVAAVAGIAQRVVAQVSEKAAREIAWEVIPDLAEALIKQEIERLKAVQSGAQPSLGASEEFQFFRHRYPLAAGGGVEQRQLEHRDPDSAAEVLDLLGVDRSRRRRRAIDRVSTTWRRLGSRLSKSEAPARPQ